MNFRHKNAKSRLILAGERRSIDLILEENILPLKKACLPGIDLAILLPQAVPRSDRFP